MPFQLPEPESYFAVIQEKSCSILADVASLIKSPQCTLSPIPLQVRLWIGGGGGGVPMSHVKFKKCQCCISLSLSLVTVHCRI